MNLLPREHGATVMFGAALIIGAGAAGRFTLASLGMLMALLGAFFARAPLTALLRRSTPAPRRRQARALALASGLVGALGATLSLLLLPLGELLLLAAVALPHFALAVLASARGFAWRWWVDASGAVAAALAAPALFFAGRGALDTAAWQLLSIVAVFYLGSTLHLRAVLRDGKAIRLPRAEHLTGTWRWSVGSVALAAALWAAGWLPTGWAALAALALLRPLLLRGPLLAELRRVGLAESVLTAALVVGLILQRPPL